jgi:hypothetical protein
LGALIAEGVGELASKAGVFFCQGPVPVESGLQASVQVNIHVVD